MEPWLCGTCGVEYDPVPSPPSACWICEDERQWVPRDGQRWTTASELRRAGYRSSLRWLEEGLLGIGVEPAVGIGQRALAVVGDRGVVVFDAAPLLDEDAAATIRSLGPVVALCFSHPHFYGAAVTWAELLGAERILVPQVDAAWFVRSSERVALYDDDVVELGEVELRRIGGHFPGSSVLWWPGGAEGRGVLLTGDSLSVNARGDGVTVMWSFPNHLPLAPQVVEAILAHIEPVCFDRLYGGWWDSVIPSAAKEAVYRSLGRYLELLTMPPTVTGPAGGPTEPGAEDASG